MSLFNPETCITCGCTDNDCSKCIKRTKLRCTWVKPGVCSACVDPAFPWGFEVKITCFPGLKEQSFHKQGTKSKVQRWCRMKSGFHQIVEMIPITKKAWHDAFGHGDRRM